MKKVSVKIPAKINLTLDVMGTVEGYHSISSLVANVNVCDTIIVKKRNDKQVTLKQKGIKVNCPKEENNAVKSAKLFMQEFMTNGVDITVKKQIPIGAGMGGSSADIAGVLLAMKILYDTQKKVKPLADRLGSDSGYMLKGGLAVISGRGENVTLIDAKLNMPIIIITEDESVTAKQSYTEYDKIGEASLPCTERAVEYLTEGQIDKMLTVIKNDLTLPSENILPKIRKNLKALKNVGAIKCVMTGSGSAVYGIFKSEKERDLAFKQLKKAYKKHLIKANII